jgi:signal transduction histidine kinase
MSLQVNCPIAAALAQRLRDEKDQLTKAWLDRIAARVNIDPNRIFPTDALLDHVPLLVVGIADYIENPTEDIASDMPVVAKAMELGALRHSQGFDAYQILKEYELLGGIIFTFSTQQLDVIEGSCTHAELFNCAHRLFRAISLIQQVTTTQFLRMGAEQVQEREERLRGFNRMVSHELKNRIGAIQGAHALLDEPWIDAEQRARFMAMIGENAEGVRATLENLVSLSRSESDARHSRHVELPQAAAEAVRQHREFARARGVRVTLSDNLPGVEVNAPAVELSLSNYISNAIKYSDPTKSDRWVRIEAAMQQRSGAGDDAELVVRVRDNGLGIPDRADDKLFQRFFRAHEEVAADIEGTGLGLSIVRETIEGLGGRAWAERGEEGGAVFAFSLPSRRGDDREGREAGRGGSDSLSPGSLQDRSNPAAVP